MESGDWQQFIASYSSQYSVSIEGDEVYYVFNQPAEYIKVNLTLEMPKIDSRMRCLNE